MKKEEITRERKWQRLTVAVVMLLAFVAQAGAQTEITVTNSGNIYQLTTGQEISFRGIDLNGDNYGCIYGWFSDADENKQIELTSGKTYKFNGANGYYGFKKYDDGRGPYIEVIPLKSNSLDRNDKTAENYLTYNINTGDGAIWAMGGANFCFMSARASGVHGWESASMENVWADNSVALVNIDRKYTLRITTGYQIAGTADFVFKFFHKPIWETYDNGWKKYYEFRGQRKDDASEGEQSIISFH